MTKKQIAQAIKRYRKRRRMSQQEFAEYMMASIRTVSRWESGQVQPSNVWMGVLKVRDII